ncbi:MAG: hypothetical protein ACRELY_22855 [Polyangiaceae bacterium]
MLKSKAVFENEQSLLEIEQSLFKNEQEARMSERKTLKIEHEVLRIEQVVLKTVNLSGNGHLMPRNERWPPSLGRSRARVDEIAHVVLLRKA